MIDRREMSHARDKQGHVEADVHSLGNPVSSRVAMATKPENQKGKLTQAQKAHKFKKFARLVSLSIQHGSKDESVKGEDVDKKRRHDNRNEDSWKEQKSQSVKQVKSAVDIKQPSVVISRKNYSRQEVDLSSDSDSRRDVGDRKVKDLENHHGNKTVNKGRKNLGDDEKSDSFHGNTLTVNYPGSERRLSCDSRQLYDTKLVNRRRSAVPDLDTNHKNDRKIKFDVRGQDKVKDTNYSEVLVTGKLPLKYNQQSERTKTESNETHGLPYLAELKEKLSSLGSHPDNWESLGQDDEPDHMSAGSDRDLQASRLLSQEQQPRFNYEEKSTLIELENYINRGGGRRPQSSAGENQELAYMQTGDKHPRTSRQKNNHISDGGMESNYSDGASSEGEIDSYHNRERMNNGSHRHRNKRTGQNNDTTGHRNRHNEHVDGEPREITRKQGHMTKDRRMNEQEYYSDEEMVDGVDREYVSERQTNKNKPRQREREMSDVRNRSSCETEQNPNVIVTEAKVHLSQEEVEDLDKLDDSPQQRRQSGDPDSEPRIRRNDRKYQSHTNLSRPLSNEDREMEQAKLAKNTSQYYTPRPRRKQRQGKYDSRQSSEDELRDLNNHIDPRVTHPISRAGSVADVGKVGEFAMPKSKMGSFQDFKPIKHSQSSPRVSTDKGE